METVAVKMPGTGKQHPNRRHKLRLPVQSLFALGSAQAILGGVRRERATPSRTGQGKASGQMAAKLARRHAHVQRHRARAMEPWLYFDV
jgi:hypothetical protein